MISEDLERYRDGWVGVDLDGTLAYWRHGQLKRWGHYDIGDPIPDMLERVKQWIKAGIDVRIFTARVALTPENSPRNVENHKAEINIWCMKHIGKSIPITCIKDNDMIELWDDRCVHVAINTGRVIG